MPIVGLRWRLPSWRRLSIAGLAGRETVSNTSDVALFCVSVDGGDPESLSTELVRQRSDVSNLLEQAGIPSNWTVGEHSEFDLPRLAERTVSVPKIKEKASLIKHLRQMNARLARDSDCLLSVVMDLHEARESWETLVRHGCQVVRPRSAEVTKDTGARIIRGGLWAAPLSCSFVGGSRRSVRGLFGICQRRIVEASRNRQLFHLNIDVGRTRKSWTEELAALKALLTVASDLGRKDRVKCVRFSELPAIATKKSAKPMLSILRAA